MLNQFRTFYGRRKSDGVVFQFQAGNEITFDFEVIDQATFEAEKASVHAANVAAMSAKWEAAREQHIAAASAQSGIDPDTLRALLSTPR